MIRSNLVEAKGEIDELRERLRYCDTGILTGASEYGEWCAKRWNTTTEHGIFVDMAHAFHHLNFAWNCRNYPEKRVVACSRRDYLDWGRFPEDWPEIWPSPSRRTGRVREVLDGKVCYLTMRMSLDDVSMTLDEVINDIDIAFPECVRPRSDSGNLRRGLVPMDENGLSVRMRHIYLCMNEAWNSRKQTMTEKTSQSAETAKRHLKFPRAFRDLWPKNWSEK